MASTCAVILALSVGLGMATYQAIRANGLSIASRKEADRADSEANRANEQKALLQEEYLKTQLLLADAQTRQGELMLAAERYFGIRDVYGDAWKRYDDINAAPWKAELGLWEVNQPLRHSAGACTNPEWTRWHGALFRRIGRLLARCFSSGLIDVRDVVTNEVRFQEPLCRARFRA